MGRPSSDSPFSSPGSDLWADRRAEARRTVEPLASRCRPRTLAEVIGQTHLLGEGQLLSRLIKADVITSLIFHGPPGTGKTSLAEVIAHHTRRRFVRENAASVGVKRIREIIDEAGAYLERTGSRTILFLDEIHRFTKAQQDVLLSDVERGMITLIGATTENPLFAVNSALVSRSTLFRLEPLTEDEIVTVLRNAIGDTARGYGKLPLEVTDDALRVWALKSEGDARRALTALEVAVESQRDGTAPDTPIVIDRATAEESIQQKVAVYDHTGDGHYDHASALIKSIRGSDPDAALYWAARMLDAGEDPRFIARRLAILASEDIGNADPRAIMVAQAAWDLIERIGMPECRITIAQTITYLALAPKSNASYVAIDDALTDVRSGRVLPVPVHIRDKNSSAISGQDGAGVKTRNAAKEGLAEPYEYSHNAEGKVTGQDYLGVERIYYRPTEEGHERALRDRLEQIRKARTIQRGGQR